MKSKNKIIHQTVAKCSDTGSLRGAQLTADCCGDATEVTTPLTPPIFYKDSRSVLEWVCKNPVWKFSILSMSYPKQQERKNFFDSEKKVNHFRRWEKHKRKNYILFPLTVDRKFID